MEKLFLLLLSLQILSCRENGKNSNTGIDTIPGANTALDTTRKSGSGNDTNWIADFRKFRDAVYHGDRPGIKQFFNFPVMNYNNEIWDLVYTGDEKIKAIDNDKIKPFTEQDFEKFFDKLFSKMFVQTILKIKSEDLYKKGKAESLTITGKDSADYTMYATFDKEEHSLTLNLGLLSAIKLDNGEFDPVEYSVIYQFDILSNGQLRFRQIRLAG